MQVGGHGSVPGGTQILVVGLRGKYKSKQKQARRKKATGKFSQSGHLINWFSQEGFN